MHASDWVVRWLAWGAVVGALAASFTHAGTGPLDPRGRIHIPIGLANTLDTLRTFVEAEGPFSPGVGSYGVYFWLYDADDGKLVAPTMDGVKCDRGLNGVGYLMPWTSWDADGIQVRTEVCEVCRDSPLGKVYVVGARAHLSNPTKVGRRVALYAALRPLGPAGFAVQEMAVSDAGDALLVEGHPALVANEKPTAAGVLPTDTIGELARGGKMPAERAAKSPSGDCSGALRFGLTLAPGETRTLGFVCPVLPGRRAVGHQWDGKSPWAQLDDATLNPSEGGLLQPDPGLAYHRELKADKLFEEATAYWRDLVGRATVKLPDPRWGEAFAAIVGHVAMCMNEGAPDVAAVNYNVFNRDGVYVANILQKSGQFELAAAAVDYFLSHPFNGRVYPEADNPGQILWCIGEHWRLAQSRAWAQSVYPSVQKLVALIRYCRTTKGPYWVSTTSLDFGDAVHPGPGKEFKPGRCDGHHPEYTEAFDVAGLRAAAALAEALGNRTEAGDWRTLADSFFESYDHRFGSRLRADYGSYCVLWPCRLYPISGGKAHEAFKGIGAQRPGGWRYFPLATAHQGLLAGNREAGHATLAAHLDHEQMRGWYALDEGGRSGAGGWRHARTTWDPSVAMPHGWAIAELWLLLRDSLLFEDGDRLVLLGGVPPAWLTGGPGIRIENLPTYFGVCSLAYVAAGKGATLTLTGAAAPPRGFVLRLPSTLRVSATADGKALAREPNGDVGLPAGTKEARLQFGN